jgi:hypothetical protein
MATSKKSTGKKSKDPMSSVGVTHVSLSVRQVSGEVKKIRGICGHGLEKPLANYDLDTQSWKMYGDISLWGDSPLLENLPVSGMTQSGVLFLQHPWEPITGETELLSWPTPRAANPGSRPNEKGGKVLEEEVLIAEGLRTRGQLLMWPTPRANVAMASLITPEIANNPNRQPNLETIVGRRMCPTPTTQETEHPDATLTETGRRLSKDGKSSHSLGLGDAVQMWPTPTAHPDNSNKNGKFKNPTLGDAVRDKETWPTPTASDWKGRGPNSKQQGLSEVVKYPTPQARDYKGPSGRSMKGLERDLPTAVGSGGRLNPTWVEWLMGFPTGWTDLEDSETQ